MTTPVAALLALGLLAPPTAPAAAPAKAPAVAPARTVEKPAALLGAFKGKVEVKTEKGALLPASEGLLLEASDTVVVDTASWATLVLPNRSVRRVDEELSLKISDLAPSGGTTLDTQGLLERMGVAQADTTGTGRLAGAFARLNPAQSAQVATAGKPMGKLGNAVKEAQAAASAVAPAKAQEEEKQAKAKDRADDAPARPAPQPVAAGASLPGSPPPPPAAAAEADAKPSPMRARLDARSLRDSEAPSPKLLVFAWSWQSQGSDSPGAGRPPAEIEALLASPAFGQCVDPLLTGTGSQAVVLLRVQKGTYSGLATSGGIELDGACLAPLKGTRTTGVKPGNGWLRVTLMRR